MSNTKIKSRILDLCHRVNLEAWRMTMTALLRKEL